MSGPMGDPRVQDALVAALGLALTGLLGALWIGASLVAGALVSLILTLTLALGALREGRLGPFGPWLAAALLAWLAAFTLMHVLPADTATLWLGLPPATAVAVYGLWPAPLVLVTLPYALHFQGWIARSEVE